MKGTMLIIKPDGYSVTRAITYVRRGAEAEHVGLKPGYAALGYAVPPPGPSSRRKAA